MSCFRWHRLARSATASLRSPGTRSRAAHTLIEILLALGLSLVILTAVYAALDQHWRYAEAGQRQTERMQLTRALFERISLDLRSVVFRPAVDLGPTIGSGNVTRIDIVQPGEPYVGRSVGIMGDAETLMVQTSSPDAEKSSGSRTVRWEILAITSNGPDGTRAARSRQAATLPTEHEAAGLARVAQDNTSPARLAAVKTISPSDLVAAEVETIRFRYFARGNWFERWDSVGQQELPRAVEITIGFRRANSGEQEAGNETSTGEYRFVVPVPASEA